MKGMTSVWLYSGYNSKSGFTYTNEWNFAPAFTAAYPIIYGISGGGLHHAGVVGYRHRPNPNGPEETVNFGSNWKAWASYIYVNNLTSVTFGTAIGASQEMYVHGNISFW